MRGPAGAVMCVGAKWEGQIQVDMRFVCPKEVKEMFMKQARSTSWKRCASKHEYEELKESIWLEPVQALLRKKRKDEWTDKHRHVARKLVLDHCPGWNEVRRQKPARSGNKKRKRRRKKGSGKEVLLRIL